MTKKEVKFKPHLVRGVGLDDTNYSKSKGEYQIIDGVRKWRVIWKCPYYQKWVNMLRRCYAKDAPPSYTGCKVCEEWKVFSNFKSWLLSKGSSEDQVLDKDLLVKSNKVYSPETCCLLPQVVNTFLLDGKNWRGKYKIGVDWHSHNNLYRSRCRNPLTGKVTLLGYFSTEEEAHESWRICKLGLAKELSESLDCEVLKLALINRYKGDYHD